MSERKEVIQFNGMTILVVIALIANFLIVGFAYRYHSHQLFIQEKIHGAEYNKLLKQQHDLHLEIVALEGAKNWNETEYVKHLQLNSSK